MGFGSLFIGFMFLYDFQLGLRHEGAETAWAMLDIFPDLLGWFLICIGLFRLAKKVKECEKLKAFSVLMLFVSVFTLAKDTLLYGTFYQNNTQIFMGETVDFAVHLMELGFVYLLFQKTTAVCRKCGEDKLSQMHATVPRIAMAEGFLFLLARTARLIALPESLLSVFNVVSVLDFLFTVFWVWYGTIAMFRCLMRISDSDL